MINKSILYEFKKILKLTYFYLNGGIKYLLRLCFYISAECPTPASASAGLHLHCGQQLPLTFQHT